MVETIERNTNTKEEDQASRSEVIGELLKKVEKKLGEDMKATLGDYIRLVQLQKDMDDEQPKEIRVTWVESETEPEK